MAENLTERMMIRRDMPEVLSIERASFESPWFEEEFVACLRQRNCIFRVAEIGERIVGFVSYELRKTRLHLLNVAVHPDFRLRGVGRALIELPIRRLTPTRRNRLTLEIRERNLGAQLFFSRMGFRCTAQLHDFYDDAPEDAYLFEYRIGAAEPAGPVVRIAT
jgi:ribosomal-protein-alanine N-acetyltransferase